MNKTEIRNFLKKTLLCKNFTAKELDAFAAVCVEEDYKAKELVFKQGDGKENVNYVYFVTTGNVQVSQSYTYSNIKKKMLINILTPGDCFGEIAMLQKDQARTATIKCITDSHFLTVNKQDFMNIYKNNPKFTANLIESLINYLNHSNNVARFVMFSSRDASSRLMYMLDFLKDKYGVTTDGIRYEVTIPFNMGLVTEFLGMKQQLFSRCKKTLQDRGLISGFGKRLVIENYPVFSNILYGE